MHQFIKCIISKMVSKVIIDNLPDVSNPFWKKILVDNLPDVKQTIIIIIIIIIRMFTNRQIATNLIISIFPTFFVLENMRV